MCSVYLHSLQHHVWEILDYITLYYYTSIIDYITLYITLPPKLHCTRKIVETKSFLVVLISGGTITNKVLLLETELRAISPSSTVSWSSQLTY